MELLTLPRPRSPSVDSWLPGALDAGKYALDAVCIKFRSIVFVTREVFEPLMTPISRYEVIPFPLPNRIHVCYWSDENKETSLRATFLETAFTENLDAPPLEAPPVVAPKLNKAAIMGVTGMTIMMLTNVDDILPAIVALREKLDEEVYSYDGIILFPRGTKLPKVDNDVVFGIEIRRAKDANIEVEAENLLKEFVAKRYRINKSSLEF